MDRLRDDILASVCILEADDPTLVGAAIGAVVEALRTRFRSWEILIVRETGRDADFDAALAAFPNLRVFSVTPGVDRSQHRFIGASEAIGDVVALTPLNEVGEMDLSAMIKDALAEEAMILGQWRAASLAEPLIAALGRLNGVRASSRDMETAVFPRAVLTRLLADSNPLLALRFPPRDGSVKVLRRSPRPSSTGRMDRAKSAARISDQLGLLARMPAEAGPAFLEKLAILSALIVAGAVLFALYALIAFLTDAKTGGEWTMLSFAIAFLVASHGAAVLGICLALRKLADVVQRGHPRPLVIETSPADQLHPADETGRTSARKPASWLRLVHDSRRED